MSELLNEVVGPQLCRLEPVLQALGAVGNFSIEADQAAVSAAAEQVFCRLQSVQHPVLENDERMLPTSLKSLHDLKTALCKQAQQYPDFFGRDGQPTLVDPLEDLLKFAQGPFAREEKDLEKLVVNFVNQAFGKIANESNQHCSEMYRWKRQIEEKGGKVQKISEDLGEDLQSSRHKGETERHRLTKEMWELHEKRHKLNTTPSTIPEFLAVTSAKLDREVDPLVEDITSKKHFEESKLEDLNKMQGEEDELLNQQRGDCQERARVARDNTSKLQRSIKSHLEAAMRELAKAKTQTAQWREQKVAEDQALKEDQELAERGRLRREHLVEAIRQHDSLRHRFESGEQLISGFRAWLKNSYKWLEKMLQDKREELRRELPDERRRFSVLLQTQVADLDRRLNEAEWTIQETKKKEANAAREHERLSRTRGRQDQAKAKREDVKQLNSDLKNLKSTLQDLQKEKCKIKELSTTVNRELAQLEGGSHEPGETTSTNNSIVRQDQSFMSRWVGSMFFNSHALVEEQQRQDAIDTRANAPPNEGTNNTSIARRLLPAWLLPSPGPAPTHRVTGKRPPPPSTQHSLDLEVPSAKRRRGSCDSSTESGRSTSPSGDSTEGSEDHFVEAPASLRFRQTFQAGASQAALPSADEEQTTAGRLLSLSGSDSESSGFDCIA